MKVTPTALAGVMIVEPRRFPDNRGTFFESWHHERYAASGMPGPWWQDNVSVSKRNVLRGLHYQYPKPQGKLVAVLSGEVFDVAVDIRRGSPAFRRWVGVILSADNGRQLYIPPGFAHGFLTLSDVAVFHYKCTEYYFSTADASIRWDDPAIGIEWPVRDPILAPKDAHAPVINSIHEDRLPPFEG
jgi:dTDP-4-dehydrorhamnose 3,5-epimerase